MTYKMNVTDRAVLAGFALLALINLPLTYAADGRGLTRALVACLEAVIWALAGQVVHSRWFEALIAALS